MLKGMIYASEMAFTLISISHLDKVSCQVVFGKEVCTICNPKGQVMAVIPHEDGLYQFVHGGPEHTNIMSAKMLISKAHCKLGHIGHAAICHVVSKEMITGIKLNMESKSEFCEPCVKDKSTVAPYPKESDNLSYPGILTKSNSNDFQTSLESSLELCSNKSLCQESDSALFY